ncbi:MAG: hypothetical protein KJ000_23555 [Pirellulaceae bacterium]|nr:hypothetical protein [Pirellulaceae bacterium]
MDRIEALLAGRQYLPDSKLQVSYEAGCANIKLGNDRSQKVIVERRQNCYLFTSTVLSAGRVASLRRDLPDFVDRMWRRNQQTDVVNFTFDRENRLIGRIEHPADTLDAEELYFYLSRLAIECDRLEFVMTGQNRF